MISSGATSPASPGTAVPELTKRTTPSQAEGAGEALSTGPSQNPRPTPPQTTDVLTGPVTIQASNDYGRSEIIEAFESDGPTGPPPAFEETLLARQAREALNPSSEVDTEAQTEANEDPPQTPSQRAEEAIAETRALEVTSEPTVDQRI